MNEGYILGFSQNNPEETRSLRKEKGGGRDEKFVFRCVHYFLRYTLKMQIEMLTSILYTLTQKSKERNTSWR
jgi:hypothetical protein